MCLVETISEHLAKLCHLSVSQGQSTNHRETSKERYLKRTTNLVEPNPDSQIAHCQAHQLPRTPLLLLLLRHILFRERKELPEIRWCQNNWIFKTFQLPECPLTSSVLHNSVPKT